jgi:hypothetical protein
MMNDSNEPEDSRDWLEDSITKEYFNYYEYSDFKNVRRIGSGGFGKIFCASWKGEDNIFVLKIFEDDKSTLKEIVNEVCLLKKKFLII